jgi:hypothetical protein
MNPHFSTLYSNKTLLYFSMKYIPGLLAALSLKKSALTLSLK